MKKVTVLGGGTGSYAVLSALKQISDIDISAIVTMLDSGGSTGRLRDQLGVLPPGDLRQCLMALSEAPEIWRKLFGYRFESGDLKGHNFGNIFLSALEKISANYDEVLDEAHYVMQCIGHVIPATLSQSHIEVRYESGRVLRGENNLDELSPDKSIIKSALATPAINANPNAIDRIINSDVIIAGPGDLYSSIISIALAKGVSDAIKKSSAKIIFIMNLMTKSSQTYNYGAFEHIRDFAKYFGKFPDICILNSSKIPNEMITRYAEFGEETVIDNLLENGYLGQVVSAKLLDSKDYDNEPGEALSQTFAHSIVRHDIVPLQKVLQNLLSSN